jgi:hypothetical protein
MAILIDSYPESNYNGDRAIYNSADLYFGEAFNNPTQCILDSAKFWLKKTGSPTGIIYAQIYASTGTLGTDAKPTGSVLATSTGISSSVLSGVNHELITFNFTGSDRITLNASTDYILVIGNIGGGLDSSNYVYIGVDTTSPTYAGNQSRSTDGSTWIASSTADLIFYIYKEGTANTNFLIMF